MLHQHLLQVRVTYHSAAVSSSNVSDIIGRQVTLPLKLAVQPTLQVKTIRFLQQTVPLKNGQRSNQQRLLIHQLQSQNSTPLGLQGNTGSSSKDAAVLPGLSGSAAGLDPTAAAAAAAAAAAKVSSNLLRTRSSLHTRNSSDGAVPAAAAAAAAQGLTAAGMLEVLGGPGSPSLGRRSLNMQQEQQQHQPEQQQQQQKHIATAGLASSMATAAAAVGFAGIPVASSSSSSSSVQLPQQEVAAYTGSKSSSSSSTAVSGATAATASGISLGVGTELVLELSVRNASDRYFR
jgi:hypothetical protein